MCDNCDREHRNSKASRHHSHLNRDEMPGKKLTIVQKFCFKHSGEVIQYICETHEQFCCSVCATLGHRQCNVLYIDDIARGFHESHNYQDFTETDKTFRNKPYRGKISVREEL